MSINFTIAVLNLVLFAILLKRLKIFKMGIFSLGFVNLFTAFFPHFILTPFVALKNGATTYTLLKARDITEHHPAFTQALLLVCLIEICLIIGTLIPNPKKTKAPMYWRFSAPYMFKHDWLVLLLFMGFWAFGIIIRGYFMGTFNPFVLVTMARTEEFSKFYRAYNLSYPILFSKGALLFCQAILTTSFLMKEPNWKGLSKSIFICLLTIGSLMVSGSRQTLLSAPIVTAFLIQYFYRPIPRWMIIGGASIALFVIPLYKSLAHGKTLQYLMDSGQLTSIDYVVMGLTQRFGNFQVMVRYLDWYEMSRMTLGFTVFSIFVRPIPRTFIPWKPPSNDIYFTRSIYGEDAAIQIHGAWGEMMYNFWLPGLIIWFILLGALLYRFHFGFQKLVTERKYLAIALILSNFAFLRSLPNLGVNTIASQNMLMTIGSQVFVIGVIWGYHYLVTTPRKQRPPLPEKKINSA